jgi:DNA-binding transcriptional regulator LsrR (DeoR family)
MMTGRARADQAARRINAAAELLATGVTVPEAIRQLAEEHRISERQARRYIERARVSGYVNVPAAKQVFTVKLASDLIDRMKLHAAASRRTLSSLVAEALEEFLERVRAGPHRGR